MSFFNRLFKFRIFKFRTTLTEELDDLHSESAHLQQTLAQTRLLQRQWTRWVAIYIFLIYLVGNIFYYTFFLSQDFLTRAYAFASSIVLAVLLYGIHWMVRWYFRKNIQAKEEKLTLFKGRRQELIEEVKNKETYAVARNLLEKYGETLTPQVRSPVTNENDKDLCQRSSIKSPFPINSPYQNGFENGNHQIQTPVRGGPARLAAGVTPGKLPRAILPPQRTFWGAMLDTIVGDGPSKRYALICKSCSSHNGMALEEEYEYLTFRCAYCNYLNGARKQKPVFNPDCLSPIQPQNGTHSEAMDMSIADATDADNQSRVIKRRSIRVPPTNSNDRRPQSMSMESKHHPALSSSEESLTDKNK